MERLFIAIALPAAQRAALEALYTPTRGLSWVPPEQLHLTLRFIGDIDANQTLELSRRLAGVRVAPFVLPLENVGAFPPRRPAHVLWAGVGQGHPRLFQLRKQIDDVLLALRLPIDLRIFHPHVTLARVKPEASPNAIAQWLRHHREFATAPFNADAFGLYASELRPAGAVHTLKQNWPLA